MRIYIIMGIDECGDEFRAHGTDFLEKEHTFPDFDEDNEAMWEAFLAWEHSITTTANEEWMKVYGPDCRMMVQESDRSVYNRCYKFHGL